VAVEGLHHFNYRGSAAQVRAIREFYCDVLGLVDGPRPQFGVPGHWLYAGDAAILHLVEVPAAESAKASGNEISALDHVALRCTDLESMIQQLRAKGVEFSSMRVPGTGAIQLFCTDPAGMGVELNFGS
jgi:extradiol dioxygenase family protein